MTMQTFALSTARLNKFKGKILKHAVAKECLSKGGRQVELPKNQSDTYVARSWIPYGGTATQPNQFFSNGTGDRTNAITQAHLTQEGVTPVPDSIVPRDVTVIINQYSCLYGFTDKTFDLYEDDIPEAQIEQAGERTTFVNEMIVFGALKACTNQFYGGTGTTRATVNGGLTLGFVRKITKSLKANHADVVTSVLGASAQYGTDAVSAGYLVYCHTDLEPDIRDLPGFTPVELYASGKAMEGEVGKCETFRFITSPDLVSVQDGGAAIGATNLYTTTGTSIDVYQIIVTAKDAWSQIAIRGKGALKPVFLPPGVSSKSDPFGQRGYVGNMWWKAVMIENNGFMAVGQVGSKIVA